MFSGPAPDQVTNKIFELTKGLKEYAIVPDLNVDVSVIGSKTFQVDGRDFTVEVIDSVNDYLELMKSIFDFRKLKSLIVGSSERKPFKILINSMHGGKYLKIVALIS